MPGSTYDYHKYNGRTNVKSSSFETRNDRYFYEKLARKRDVIGFLVANLSENPKLWIGDIFSDEAEVRYARFCRVCESLSYTMQTELCSFDVEFDELLRFIDGVHPPILKAYMNGRVSPEVLYAIDKLVHFTEYWRKYSWDPTVKRIIHRIGKLDGFVPIDEKRIREILVRIFPPEDPTSSK